MNCTYQNNGLGTENFLAMEILCDDKYKMHNALASIIFRVYRTLNIRLMIHKTHWFRITIELVLAENVSGILEVSHAFA